MVTLKILRNSILGIFDRYSLMQELIRRSLTLMVKLLLIGLVSIMNLVLQESSLIEVAIRIVRRVGIEDGNTSLYIDKKSMQSQLYLLPFSGEEELHSRGQYGCNYYP